MKKRIIKAGMRVVSFKDAQSTLQKNHHLDKKVGQMELKIGSYLLISKFAFKKVEDPCENHVCFKSCTFPKNIGMCMHHYNLLQSLIFAFISPCSV